MLSWETGLDALFASGKVNGGNSVIFVVKLLFINEGKEDFSAT